MKTGILRAHLILYVKDQAKSAAFYAHVLGCRPTLNVPGMTEFTVAENCILGLMPVAGIRRLLGERLPDPEQAAGIPRAEVYLLVDDPGAYHQRALEAGAQELSALALRDWGDLAAYSLDPDGHVLAFAGKNEPVAIEPGTQVQVTQEWKVTYPDPLILTVGEQIQVGRRDDEWPGWIWCTHANGKSGWALESRLKVDETIHTATVLQDYTAIELEIQPGEHLVIQQVESSWAWATNEAGQSGWAPLSHIAAA